MRADAGTQHFMRASVVRSSINIVDPKKSYFFVQIFHFWPCQFWPHTNSCQKCSNCKILQRAEMDSFNKILFGARLAGSINYLEKSSPNRSWLVRIHDFTLAGRASLLNQCAAAAKWFINSDRPAAAAMHTADNMTLTAVPEGVNFSRWSKTRIRKGCVVRRDL